MSRRERRRERSTFSAGEDAVVVLLSLPITGEDEQELRRTQTMLADLRETFGGNAGRTVLLDMERCPKIDAVGSLLLKATLQRGMIEHEVRLDVRWPRSRTARFFTAVAGFDGERAPKAVRDARAAAAAGDMAAPIGTPAIQVISGSKKDATTTGQLTFEAARLADQMGDPALANRVHAALNEAADNVLSWAYKDSTLPEEARRWWALGQFTPGRATMFIALDHGATIPATAPQTLGGEIDRIVNLLRARGARVITPVLSDAEVLEATIAYKRSQSGKDERGKGLANMIGLIDRFETGEILIISGRALYAYRRVEGGVNPQEVCRPMAFRFEGTLILWIAGSTFSG